MITKREWSKDRILAEQQNIAKELKAARLIKKNGILYRAPSQRQQHFADKKEFLKQNHPELADPFHLIPNNPNSKHIVRKKKKAYL